MIKIPCLPVAHGDNTAQAVNVRQQKTDTVRRCEVVAGEVPFKNPESAVGELANQQPCLGGGHGPEITATVCTRLCFIRPPAVDPVDFKNFINDIRYFTAGDKTHDGCDSHAGTSFERAGAISVSQTGVIMSLAG